MQDQTLTSATDTLVASDSAGAASAITDPSKTAAEATTDPRPPPQPFDSGAAEAASRDAAGTGGSGCGEDGGIASWYGDVVAVLVLLSNTSDKIRIGGLIKYPDEGVGYVLR